MAEKNCSLGSKEREDLESLRCPDPFRILGFHHAHVDGQTQGLIRIFNPDFSAVEILTRQGETPCRLVSGTGCFEALFPDRLEFFPYRVRARLKSGGTREYLDPYAFSPVLTDFDLHLFGLGEHTGLWRKLGANPIIHQEEAGTHFAVWAPNALGVGTTGDFNAWNKVSLPLKRIGQSGVWELFIPGISAGAAYKFVIHDAGGKLVEKPDPFARGFASRERWTAMVIDTAPYSWGDSHWMEERRRRTPPDAPSIFELKLHVPTAEKGRPPGTLAAVAESLLPRLRADGYTHLQLCPVQEPAQDSALRPEAMGFYAPDSRLGHPGALKEFVDRCHRQGFPVILEWIGAGFPAGDHGLDMFDGTSLFGHEDRTGAGEGREGARIFDLGEKRVANFVLANALYWLEEFHFDGLHLAGFGPQLFLDFGRQAGEWMPNPDGSNVNYVAAEFVKRLAGSVREAYPGCLLSAEPALPMPPGDLDLDFAWDASSMEALLGLMRQDPDVRKHHQESLATWIEVSAGRDACLPFTPAALPELNELLSRLPGDEGHRFAGYRLLFAMLFALPGPKLHFMGLQSAQAGLLHGGLDQADLRAGLHKLMADLNRLLQKDAGLRSPRTVELLNEPENSLLAFARGDESGETICLFNFGPVPRRGCLIGASRPGIYLELLNSDSRLYGGGEMGNPGSLTARAGQGGPLPYSLEVAAPPLTGCFFGRTGNGA